MIHTVYRKVCTTENEQTLWLLTSDTNVTVTYCHCNNRYEALAAEDDLRHKTPQIHDNPESENDSEDPEDETTRSQKKQRIPPITITRAIQDYSKTLAELRNATPSKQIKAALVKEGLSVRVKTREDYEALRKALDKGKVPYFTHMFKDQRPKILVLKGLPSLPMMDIMDDIEKQGIKCEKVALLKPRSKINDVKAQGSNRSHHPSILVTVNHGVNLRTVRNIKYVC